jgi:hypothetical protein
MRGDLLFFDGFLLFSGIRIAKFHHFQESVELLIMAFPVLAVFFKPLRGIGERAGFEAARAALSVATARDESSMLENFEVFGDGGLGHFERFGKFHDGSFARREASEDGAASRVSQSGERGVELGGRHLYNRQVV